MSQVISLADRKKEPSGQRSGQVPRPKKEWRLVTGDPGDWLPEVREVDTLSM